MGIVRKQIVALYVDRSNQQWVALDPDGNFWTLPGGDNSWDQRQPYRPTNEVGQLEDFQLRMTTDFAAIDFPKLTMSPSHKEAKGKGYELEWKFARLVAGYGIGSKLCKAGCQPIDRQPAFGLVKSCKPNQIAYA